MSKKKTRISEETKFGFVFLSLEVMSLFGFIFPINLVFGFIFFTIAFYLFLAGWNK